MSPFPRMLFRFLGRWITALPMNAGRPERTTEDYRVELFQVSSRGIPYIISSPTGPDTLTSSQVF